jgi:uncharacterized protein (TIGR03084 family)
MQDILEDLADQHVELAGLLNGLDEDGWQRYSPCSGWSIADVVLHLAQTDEMAIASIRGTFAETVEALTEGITGVTSVDEGVDSMVQRERGAPGDAVGKRWAASAEELRRELAAADPGKRVTWVAGELAAKTLAVTRIAETWFHTRDVAEGLGVTIDPTDRIRHIARLAWRTLPYAFMRDGRELSGPVAFLLRAPTGVVWEMVPDEPALTTVTGDAFELCLVAGQRLRAEQTGLVAEGPDAADVLRLVRSYA